MKIKIIQCHECGSKNVYTTIEYTICRKCGYKRERVLDVIDKLKEEKEDEK